MKTKENGMALLENKFIMKIFYYCILIVLMIQFFALNLYSQTADMKDSDYLTEKKCHGSFKLTENRKSAPIIISSNDYEGVIRVAKNFKSDLGKVTGFEPELYFDKLPNTKEIVIAGTIGKNRLLDEIIKSGKMDVSSVKDKWEAFIIVVVENPLEGIDRALIVAGNDKRGTIFGLYDLSEKIGVSPWHWWADVPVKKKSSIYIKPGICRIDEPKVKYRGIFINDEAPALAGWAHEMFGGFNHKFYVNVFDLILRLKGNFLWPAMWGRSFYTDDTLNPKFADEYGVVIGTSHHEPLMRAHVEWGKGPGTWNYQKNEDTLKEFWRQGIKRMGSNESIITLGMRGDGDEPMSEDSNIDLLQKIVTDQRRILTDVTGKEITSIPQVWALYKEVQDYYDKGMRVPDDVTLLLCDDNWGNIRKLPKLDEKPHPGGYGIYYHFDYVGDPRNYKWLNTNQISRVWEQMRLAYEYGVDKIWIVNVGDIKPMEFPIDFFLNYAWNPEKIKAEDLPRFSEQWAEKQFGKKYSKEIGGILDDYTRFNSRRKPELLSPTTYSHVNFREFERIVNDYNILFKKAEEVGKLLPKNYRDAYFQLVLHPVSACATINEMYFWTGRNHLYANQGRISANKLPALVKKYFDKDSAISYYYNNILSGGKWSHMMDQTHISYTYWQQPEDDTIPATKKVAVRRVADMGIAVEGSEQAITNNDSEILLPEFDVFNKQSYYVDVFNLGSVPFNYKIETLNPCIKINPKSGRIADENRIMVSIDWKKAPTGKNKFPIVISGTNKKITVYAVVFNPETEEINAVKGYVESNGYISIEAEKFQKSVESERAKWLKIPLIGRTLSGITITPGTVAVKAPGAESPHLEYHIYLFSPGKIKVKAYLSPTLNFPNEQGLRYAVSIDDETPQIINMHTKTDLEAWKKQVADNVNIQISTHTITKPGRHTLKFWLVDPAVVLQKIVILSGKEKESYLGPPESRFIK